MAVIALSLVLAMFASPSATAGTSTPNHKENGASIAGDHGFESSRLEYNNTDVCPTWFLHNTSKTCVCGSSLHDIIRCDPSTNQTLIHYCNCMTVSNVSGSPQTVAGRCLYNCFITGGYIRNDSTYCTLPKNVFLLNSSMCGRLNRDGVLCGKCKAGFLLAPYSYNLQCFNCTYTRWNWMWYILAAYGPLTVFFIIVVSCRVSVSSGHLTAFVQFSQLITAPLTMRVFIGSLGSYADFATPELCLRIVAALYGIWNLDFFRILMPPMCLNVTALQATTLDYGIAVYPLILIVITYILLELHERNFRLVVWIWRPFHRCFACLRNHWDIKTSIIDAFVTFFFLSYVKIVSVSSDILLFVKLYSVNGENLGKYLYYNASVEYLGKEHLPYAITAIAALVILNLPIIILLLYPLRTFQKFLDNWHLRSHILTAFTDSIQGCYKDGTNGTRDCRYFSVMYIIARLVGIGMWSSLINAYFPSLAALMLVIIAILYFLFQPYKRTIYNTIDVILLLNLAMLCISCTAISVADVRNLPYINLSLGLVCIFTAAPLVYVIALFLYWMIRQKRLPQTLMPGITRRFRGSDEQQGEALVQSLPHRLLCPHQYNRVPPLAAQVDEEDEDVNFEDSDGECSSDSIQEDLYIENDLSLNSQNNTDSYSSKRTSD